MNRIIKEELSVYLDNVQEASIDLDDTINHSKTILNEYPKYIELKKQLNDVLTEFSNKIDCLIDNIDKEPEDPDPILENGKIYTMVDEYGDKEIFKVEEIEYDNNCISSIRSFCSIDVRNNEILHKFLSSGYIYYSSPIREATKEEQELLSKVIKEEAEKFKNMI